MPEKHKVILLADDDTEDQEILEESILMLAPKTDIRTVNNGQQVIDYLATCGEMGLPCLIILDYKMPILNAVEVLERISRNRQYESIPKVVWSSSQQPDHVKQCIDNGASNYFVKPNKAAELTSMTKTMLDLCCKD